MTPRVSYAPCNFTERKMSKKIPMKRVKVRQIAAPEQIHAGGGIMVDLIDTAALPTAKVHEKEWKSIRNTRWTADDGSAVGGAELTHRLMKRFNVDLPGALDMIAHHKRGQSIATGVSGYTRVW